MIYNTKKAVSYANQWALSRNPKYYNFDNFELGGDCTNFVSQCIYAGSGKMNFTKTFGWFYVNLNYRSPAWTGVEQLYKFLINNKSFGPYGKELPLEKASAGDIIQLSFDGLNYGHSLFVLDSGIANNPEDILIACHTYDSLNKPLSLYQYTNARLIHILGVR